MNPMKLKISSIHLSKRKMNKKAWLRIVEALIAVLIVVGSVLVIMSQQNKNPDISEDVYKRQKQILDVLSKDEIARQLILDKNIPNVKSRIDKLIPSNWGFDINICDLDAICGAFDPVGNPLPIDREVYASEVVVSSTLTQYGDATLQKPQKLRFFVWMK